MTKSKLLLTSLALGVSLVHGVRSGPGLFQANERTTASRLLRGNQKKTTIPCPHLNFYSLPRLSGGLKGARQKRNANRNEPHTQGHFYDDDDFMNIRNYYDDEDYSYDTTARKASYHNKKGKKHYKTNYGDDEYYDVDDVQGTFGLRFDDDDCEMVSLEDTFTIPSATFFLAPDTTTDVQGTPSLPGTVFLWDNELVGSPAVSNSTTVSGTCTRTSSSLGGICNFVFLDTIEDISVTVAGFLSNPSGGSLAITGGTGDLFANIGQMQFVPVYQDSAATGQDVFLDAVEYDVSMNLGIIVCPDAAAPL